jgi:hypothetical protein
MNSDFATGSGKGPIGPFAGRAAKFARAWWVSASVSQHTGKSQSIQSSDCDHYDAAVALKGGRLPPTGAALQPPPEHPQREHPRQRQQPQQRRGVRGAPTPPRTGRSPSAAPGRFHSIISKNRQHIGKSQPKRPHKMWKRPLTGPMPRTCAGAPSRRGPTDSDRRRRRRRAAAAWAAGASRMHADQA